MVFAAGQTPWNKLELSEHQMVNLCLLYESGVPMNDICSAVGCKRTFVQTTLKDLGLRRSKGDARRMLATTGALLSTSAHPDVLREWTPETAWVWGLWFGDGWVRPGSVCLCGTLEVLEKVKAVIGCTSKLRNGRGCYSVAFGAQSMVMLVEEMFSLKPGKKSHIIQWPRVPDDVLPQFVRGLWDSDGSWWVQKRKHYQYLYGGYCSASVDFVRELAEVLHRVVGVRLRPVEKQKYGSIVRYSSRDATKIGEWMYDDGREDIRCSKRLSVFDRAKCVKG